MVLSMALIVSKCFALFAIPDSHFWEGESNPSAHETSILWLCTVISLSSSAVPMLSSQT